MEAAEKRQEEKNSKAHSVDDKKESARDNEKYDAARRAKKLKQNR